MIISTVRQKIADVITANVVSSPTLTALAYLPDAVSAPVIFTADIDVEFDRAFNGGMDQVMFTLRLLVSRADDRAAQLLLDGYISGSGAASIRTAIELGRAINGAAGGTLGGAAADMHLKSMTAYRWFQVGDTQFLGAEFSLLVIGLR